MLKKLLVRLLKRNQNKIAKINHKLIQQFISELENIKLDNSNIIESLSTNYNESMRIINIDCKRKEKDNRIATDKKIKDIQYNTDMMRKTLERQTQEVLYLKNYWISKVSNLDSMISKLSSILEYQGTHLEQLVSLAAKAMSTKNVMYTLHDELRSHKKETLKETNYIKTNNIDI